MQIYVKKEQNHAHLFRLQTRWQQIKKWLDKNSQADRRDSIWLTHNQIKRVLWGETWLSACACVRFLCFYETTVFFSYVEISLCNFSWIKKKEKRRNNRIRKDNVLAQTYIHPLLPDTSSLCYFHLLLWAMILQKVQPWGWVGWGSNSKGRNEELTRSRLPTQFKHNLEKWTHRNRLTEGT